MKVYFNLNRLWRKGFERGLGTENFGQFMIFELPVCYMLHVLNFKRVAHEDQSPPNGTILRVNGGGGSKRNRIDTAGHLIFNVHHLVTATGLEPTTT